MTKTLVSAVVFILFFALSAKCEIFEGSVSRPAVNAAQVFVMDPSYKNDVGAFFREAKAKGVDTVYFRVFHNSGDRSHFGISPACSSGVYFKTEELCTVNDILAQVIKAAHANGIKLYAWMATRSLTALKKDKNISLAFSPDGSVISGYGANIFKKDVRDNLLQLFEDLASYEIDGILFQDDFIIKYAEGADDEARALFLAETGIEAKPETFFKGIKEHKGKKVFTGFKDEFYIWADWKAKHMSKLFAELKQRAKSVNPSLMFAANLYYETPLYPQQGLMWYSQKIPYLVNAGADYLAVMGYHEQIGLELKKNTTETALFIGDIANAASKSVSGQSSRVVMKLQTTSFSKDASLVKKEIFNEVCSSVRKTDGISVAVVPIFTSKNIYESCFVQ